MLDLVGLLEPHKLDFLKWMVAMDQNDINGLLADEMGMGKTIMTITLICYLWETNQLFNKHI